MRRRRDRLKNLATTLDQLRKSHEARIASLARADAALVNKQESLVEALAADQPCHGLFVGVTARRIASLQVERAALAQALRVETARRALAHQRAQTADKMLARFHAACEDADERRRLEDLAPLPTGSGKPGER